MSSEGPTRSNRSVIARARLRHGAVCVLAALLVSPLTVRAQDGTIAGTVVAEGSARPIAGAQISVPDQPGRAAVSDASGRFRLTGLTGTQVTLTARMIGYRSISQSARVGATDIRFAMSERAVELEQIVVTGTAGTQEKRAIGNSVAKVQVADVVASSRVASVQDLINGRAPGVAILPGTGMVGSGSAPRRSSRSRSSRARLRRRCTAPKRRAA